MWISKHVNIKTCDYRNTWISKHGNIEIRECFSVIIIMFRDTNHLFKYFTQGVTDGIHGPVTHAPHHSFHCDTTDGYVHLKGGHAQLCVHIVTQHRVNWVNAQSACQKERGHLVVLNTGAKAQVLRRHLARGTCKYKLSVTQHIRTFTNRITWPFSTQQCRPMAPWGNLMAHCCFPVVPYASFWAPESQVLVGFRVPSLHGLRKSIH